MRQMRLQLLIVSLLMVVALLTTLAQSIGQAQSPDAGCTAAPSGLVSWWPGDGNANDIQGNNNGTLFQTTFVSAEVNQGFNFASSSGSGAGVVVGNPANLQLNASLTIDAWIRRSDATKVSNDSRGGVVFGYGSGGYILGLLQDGELVFGKNGASNPPVASGAGFAVTDTNFHHVAVTKSGSAVNLYLDGVFVNPGPYDPGFTFTTNAAIGALGDDGTASFLGTIDEVDIFNRSLSATEIQAIYNAGSAGKCKAAPTPTPTSSPTPTPSPTATPSPTPTSTTVQFSNSLYVVGEGDGRVTLTVTRSGNTSAASNVGFFTSDNAGSQPCNVFNGQASSRCDYLNSIGAILFAAGETSKTISIPIVDDSYAEGNETFNVTLNNPSGASLGTQSATSVMIVDNETVTGPNPVDQSSFFVRQHYLDFLDREPDTSGLNFWVNNIESCAADANCRAVKRIDTSAAFFLSIEFQQTGYLVERIYKASFGDATGTSTLGGTHQLSVPIVRHSEFLPDTQGIGLGVIVNQGNWQQQLENNKQAFTLEFVQRSRFTSAFSTALTPGQFVDKLFLNAGVTPQASERTAAVNEFGSATTTADVGARSRALRDVAENSTFSQQEFNRAFVLMQFLGYLRRNPNSQPDTDYTGYDFWLTKLNSFNGNYQNAEMVKAFIVSSEYRQRFGP